MSGLLKTVTKNMNNAIAGTQDGTGSAQLVRAVKVCHRCGQNLSRQRRFRDKSGYWCVACSKADNKVYRANHLPCDDCGCDVQRGRERLVDDHRLCAVCWQKRQTEAVRQEMRQQVDREADESGQQRRKTIRKWSIAGLELIVASVLIVYLFPAAPEEDFSAEAQPAAATTRPLTATTS